MQDIKIERILFATDFLESSRMALDYAVALAHHFKSRIIMLHVVELSTSAREAELFTKRASLSRTSAADRLAAFASSVQRTGLEVEFHTVDGLPSHEILKAVQSFHADLLVLGVQNIHRGMDHLLLGSNTEKILLSVSCPTLTVGPHVFGGIDLMLHLEEILYLSDFTPQAAQAAPCALMLAKSYGVPVDVCQLLPPGIGPQQREQLADRYCQALKEVLGDEEPAWCKPEFQLECGLEVDQIIERAESHTAGLIVLGVKMQSQLERHLHTSFAYQLLAKATCPVLTVRSRHPGKD